MDRNARILSRSSQDGADPRTGGVAMLRIYNCWNGWRDSNKSHYFKSKIKTIRNGYAC